MNFRIFPLPQVAQTPWYPVLELLYNYVEYDREREREREKERDRGDRGRSDLDLLRPPCPFEDIDEFDLRRS